ncbi:hypothetical protein TCAL_16256 [Tigriopus californicus]|uniref:Essential protein Yae1 N-terminal domain-containing protein n=1 Tax=Tigriopus californicus TaxID=6832 RepID=A0A553N902_TIGCA|nr:hypothetical protein TCAL_16256 [Tigriopus californicus]
MDDSDDEFDDLAWAKKDFQRIHSERFKAGFREAAGIEDSQEASEALQEAFDAGYQVGFEVAKQLSLLHTKLGMSLGLHETGVKKLSQEEVEKFESEYKSIKLRYTLLCEKEKSSDPLGSYLNDPNLPDELDAMVNRIRRQVSQEFQCDLTVTRS